MVLLLLYFVNYIFIYFTVIRMWNVHLVEQGEQFKKAENKLKTFVIQNIIVIKLKLTANYSHLDVVGILIVVT